MKPNHNQWLKNKRKVNLSPSPNPKGPRIGIINRNSLKKKQQFEKKNVAESSKESSIKFDQKIEEKKKDLVGGYKQKYDAILENQINIDQKLKLKRLQQQSVISQSKQLYQRQFIQNQLFFLRSQYSKDIKPTVINDFQIASQKDFSQHENHKSRLQQILKMNNYIQSSDINSSLINEIKHISSRQQLEQQSLKQQFDKISLIQFQLTQIVNQLNQKFKKSFQTPKTISTQFSFQKKKIILPSQKILLSEKNSIPFDYEHSPYFTDFMNTISMDKENNNPESNIQYPDFNEQSSNI